MSLLLRVKAEFDLPRFERRAVFEGAVVPEFWHTHHSTVSSRPSPRACPPPEPRLLKLLKGDGGAGGTRTHGGRLKRTPLVFHSLRGLPDFSTAYVHLGNRLSLSLITLSASIASPFGTVLTQNAGHHLLVHSWAAPTHEHPTRPYRTPNSSLTKRALRSIPHSQFCRESQVCPCSHRNSRTTAQSGERDVKPAAFPRFER